MRAQYIDHMGDDLAVVNAARVSFDKGSEWEIRAFESEEDAQAFESQTSGAQIDYEYVSSDRWFGGYPVKYLSERDAKLISFLARNGHWTPFAHTAIKLRMGAPLPIRTQCFKHKSGFVENEESRRYITSEPELFVPESFRIKAESAKQGSGAEHPFSRQWIDRYQEVCSEAIETYTEMIADGICPEQARFILPQGVMVNWVWTGSLAAYARFYKQRTDRHAQKEARDLAVAVAGIIQPLFPVSWAALTDGGAS